MLTKSYWNHIGQYEEEADLRGYVIEALGSGVVKTPIEKYLNNKRYVLKAIRWRKEAFKDDEEYRKGLQTSRQKAYFKIGLDYDWGAVFFLGLKFIFKAWLRKRKKNLWQSRDKVFCSEFICENDYRISSLYPYLYQGKTKQKCDTTTPKDCGKAITVKFITGVNKL